ncbi:MAG: rhodanese-like domain-containing protein [Saprospiraceae bacterium]|nr:rhodanese-like domain-containing protein [Saprospiraceae bacterium]MCB9325708.1 rhodanese-like domain-containing protein [Lewinellaceae bacterium]
MSFLKKLFGGPEIESAESIRAKVKKGALILDVRTEQEFESGHILGAVNIPLGMINEVAEDIKKQKKVVLAYCRSGRRSEMATNLLKRRGVEVYNAGGYAGLNAILKR